MPNLQEVKMSPIVYQNYEFLKTLAKTKSFNKKKEILHKASTEQLLVLAEICLNIVRGWFKLTTRQKKRMIPYADFIRKLSRTRSERGAKKIVQKGSGPGPLFSSILTPIIFEIARTLMSKDGNK